jgi:LysR family transcriptional regulator (chromosome initiation inhibitor)
MPYRPAASPAFAARWFPDGATPEALDSAPLVVFDRTDDLQDRFLRSRQLRPDDGGTPRPPRPPRHHVPSTMEYLDAVRLGLGWGMLPELQAGPLLPTGDVVLIDSDAVIDVPLHLQQWTLRSDALDRVSAALRDEARRRLLPLR